MRRAVAEQRMGIRSRAMAFGGGGGGPAPETFRILKEDGFALLTEAGNKIAKETPSWLLSRISTPTHAWGDIGAAGSTPWYSDAGTTPAVPTNGVYRLAEHISGTQYLQQVTGAARPTLSAADLNGRSYLSFDGGDSLETPNNMGKSGDFAAEMVCVVKLGSHAGDSSYPWFMGALGGGQGWLIGPIGGSTFGHRLVACQNVHDLPTLDWHVFRAVKTPGLLSATGRLFIDGVESPVDSTAGDQVANMTDAPLNVGSLLSVGPSLVAAMFYYATPLADEQRAADDAAIMNWFGL